MGFIKVSDSLRKWAWINDPKTVYIYIRLLLGAAWQDMDIGNVHLTRGEIAISQRDFATQCLVTRQELRTALNRLISTQKITQRTEHKVSIITLCEYDCETCQSAQTPTIIQPNNNPVTTRYQPDNNPPTLLNTEIQNNKRPEIHARARGAPEFDSQSLDTKKSNKPEKRKFAEFVSMTNNEYSLLVTKLGEQGAKRCIEILDNYKGSSGKKYANDYRTILSWVIDRYREEQAKHKQQTSTKASFDTKRIKENVMKQYMENGRKNNDV